MYSDQGLYDGSPAFIWKDHQLRAWSKMYGPQMYLHGGPASPTDLPAKKINSSTVGMYPMEMKLLSQTEISTPVFTAALFALAKGWKQPKC